MKERSRLEGTLENEVQLTYLYVTFPFLKGL